FAERLPIWWVRSLPGKEAAIVCPARTGSSPRESCTAFVGAQSRPKAAALFARLLRLSLRLRAERRPLLPHRRFARPRRRGDAALRRLARAAPLRRTAPDQTARPLRRYRAGESAVRRGERVDGAAAVGARGDVRRLSRLSLVRARAR